MRAFKVFETQKFERGIDPKDSMSIGDVSGRLMKKYREEAIQAMEEILDTYGGDGPFFLDKHLDDTGFKIAIYRDEPIQSKYQIQGANPEIRYYMDYNIETEAFFVGWEQEDVDGKWRDRQWTSKLTGTGNNIETIEQAKHILIDYIQGNKSIQN